MSYLECKKVRHIKANDLTREVADTSVVFQKVLFVPSGKITYVNDVKI